MEARHSSGLVAGGGSLKALLAFILGVAVTLAVCWQRMQSCSDGVSVVQVSVAQAEASMHLVSEVQLRVFGPGFSAPPADFLAGCKMLYLDMGANVGTKVRQVFEPNTWPGPRPRKWQCPGASCGDGQTPSQEVFDEVFGEPSVRLQNLREMCVVSIEANPKRAKRLKEIETCYQSLGWRAFFVAPVAVADYAGTLNMYSDDDDYHQNWGFSRFAWKSKTPVQVPTIDIGHFFEVYVKPHNIRKIHVKCDIEGAEFAALPSLLRAGGLCSDQGGATTLAIEWHDGQYQAGDNGKGEKERLAEAQAIRDKWISDLSKQSCVPSQVLGHAADDESYLWDTDNGYANGVLRALPCS